MGAETLKREPAVSEVPATRKQVAVPADWLDRLLSAACEVPPDAPVERRLELILDAAVSAVDDAAFGACVPMEESQVVVRRSCREGSSHSDPARLFPDFRSEQVLSIPYDEGSTLHVATDTDDEDGVARIEAFAERVAQVVGSSIRRSRTYAVADRRADEIDGLQAQVIQSEKLASLGQIAAGIVHELNNPLTSIVAYSDYLRRRWEQDGADEADRQRLQRINEAAQRILMFSRDLIAYSRPATEVPAPVFLHDVIDRALVFCEHVIDTSTVSVERAFGDIRAIRGVPGQLTQVFVNLFTNACHAMERTGGGKLMVSTTLLDDGSLVEVKVMDQGHGIDEELRERIFEPFVSTKTDGGGTGLGLSIVRKIVDGHGGEIRAEANEPRGTIFVVHLPVSAGVEAGASEEAGE